MHLSTNRKKCTENTALKKPLIRKKERDTDNLTRQNKSFPIKTSFLVVVINGLLSCREELQQEGK